MKSIKFTPANMTKMREFLGLIIPIGIIKKLDLKIYFTANKMLETLFFNSDSLEQFSEYITVIAF